MALLTVWKGAESLVRGGVWEAMEARVAQVRAEELGDVPG